MKLFGLSPLALKRRINKFLRTVGLKEPLAPRKRKPAAAQAE